MPERTAEQTILFELARSKQLRESSHTTQEENPGAYHPTPTPTNPATVPNPAYEGLSGIFNQINDALSGKYQAQVKK